jgi:hypothetical protein
VAAKEKYGPGSRRLILMDLTCGHRAAFLRPDESYGTDRDTAWGLADARGAVACVPCKALRKARTYVGSVVASRAAAEAETVLA